MTSNSNKPPDINIAPDGVVRVGTEAEIGRKLKASELKAATIVVVRPPRTEHTAISMWVLEVNREPPNDIRPYVVFYSGILKIPALNYINSDDEVYDNTLGIVEVYEYLGEP